jgi:hypothetical protein
MRALLSPEFVAMAHAVNLFGATVALHRLSANDLEKRAGKTGMSAFSLTQRMLMAGSAMAALALAGCTTPPTYGTGVSVTTQLMEDVSSAVSLSPKKGEKIAYAPRPGLVKPGNPGDLPAPQTRIVDQSGAWPESPEERRARLRAEATASADDPFFRPKIAPPQAGGLVREQQVQPVGAVGEKQKRGFGNILGNAEQRRENFNERIANKPDVQGRRYLSEPPVQYQQPAQTAVTNDVGEDESIKERRRKKLLREKGDRSWRDFVPFL